MTFGPTGIGNVPAKTGTYTISGLYTQTVRLALPAGASVVSGPTVKSQGYYYKPTKPATHTALVTTATLVTDAHAPGGKIIKEYTATNIPGGDDYLASTITIKLKATSPQSDKYTFGLVSVPPVGSTPKSADPAVSFVTKVTGVPLYGTIEASLDCWPYPSPQPPFVSTNVIDNTAPAITIATPGNLSKVVQNATVHSNYSCIDPPIYGDGIKSCSATLTTHPLANGGVITSAVLGPHTVKVHTVNNSTYTSTQSSTYTVIKPPYNLVPPTVTITSPVNGAQYVTGSTVKAKFSCHANTGTTLVYCTGTVATGASISTTAGYHTFTVKALDGRGNPTKETVGYYDRTSNTPTTTTSGDQAIGSTRSSSNFSCSLFYQLNDQRVDGLDNTSRTCIFGAHDPEATWQVIAPAGNGGQLAIGDKLTVTEQIFRPGANANTTKKQGGYVSGPYKETLALNAPAGTVITGHITTSKTGLASATYGATASASGASACNYNYLNSDAGSSGQFCTNGTGNIGSVSGAAAPSTTVGAYASTTINTLFSTKVKSTTNGKKLKTISTLHVTSDTSSPSSGHLEIQTSTGTAVLAYTGHSSTTFTGVTRVSVGFTTSTVATGNFVRQPLTSANVTVLPIASVTGFQTTAGGEVKVGTTGGAHSAIFRYTSDSTSNTTCGKNPCFTTVTKVSGTGSIAKGDTVAQVDQTIATNVTLHAAADTSFAASGTLHVATATGTAVVSYTSDSTTAATCGSAACFKGITWKSGAKGAPTVGGAITQALATVSTFTGSGTVTATTAVTGFHSPGLIQVHTTSGTAWLTYTGTSSDSFTGVSDDSGTGSVTTGTIVESGPGSNGYTGYTTYGGAALTVTHTATSLATVTTQTATRPVTTLPTVTVTNLATASSTSTSLTGGNLPVASTTAEPFTTSGTLQVTTSTGVATLSYTGISGNTFTGVKYVSGAKGHIYKGAIVAEPTATSIHGATKVNGTAVTGWTWSITATGATSVPIVWNGSSCENNTGSPSPTGYAACGSNSGEHYGIDGQYILLRYTLKVTSTGTITLPGVPAIGADQHDYQPAAGILTGIITSTGGKWQYGSTLFATAASSAPGISWTAVDPNPPTATLSAPSQGAAYSFGQTVKASFTCSDPTPGRTISSCVGIETTGTVTNQKTVASGSSLTTNDLVHNEIHTFKVTATNTEGYTSTSYATFITLAAPPVLPATNTLTVTSGQSVTVPFTYSGTYPVTHASEHIVTPPQYGTVVIQPTGKITYTNNNSAHAHDSFQFAVSDTADNPSNVETVQLNVQNRNQPTISAVTPPATGSGSYARGAVTNATYSCGDTVEVISCTAEQTVTNVETAVTNGQPFDTTSLIVGNTHHLKITAVGFGGSLGNQTTTETVSYTVNTPAPVASNFTVKVPSSSPTTIHVLTHVTSTFPLTGGTLQVVKLPTHGSATVLRSHVVQYTPGTIGNEVRHDSFTFNVKDIDNQLSNTATVGITIYPVPVITSISRTGGPLAGGTQVTITGTGFSTVTHVKFGTTTGTTINVLSPTQLIVKSPAHAASTVGISVTTLGGTSATTSADIFQYSAYVPSVSAISPASGPAAGGTTVTVSGKALTGATTVFFGANKGSTISVNAAGTVLTVKSPPGTSGSAVNVRVKTAEGTSPVVSADLFTYGPTLTSLSPATGSTAGGTQVTITGTGFSTVTHVKFATTTAQSFTVRSATQLVAVSPVHAAGTVGVSVTTTAGTTPTTVHDIYKYVIPVPVVSAVSPASGPSAGGTTVTVSGSGLAGATTVFFGASKGSTISVNAGGTQLTVKSPPGHRAAR